MESRGTAYDPWAHAERLGIQVLTRALRTAHALWVPEARTILIRPRMRRVMERSVLAHELGHAHHGHRDDRPKHELQADRFAAHHLLVRHEIERVAAASPDPNVWCHELGVNARLLRRYLLDNRISA